MASFHNPRLLLLDEHTAALDPKTAAKVLELTVQIVKEHTLTAMMVTHNMKDAIRIGNRLIMMHKGKCILDISGEEKQRLEVNELLAMFEKASGEEMDNDRMLLG
jgi:putative ABC transport system ATP-binding protein